MSGKPLNLLSLSLTREDPAQTSNRPCSSSLSQYQIITLPVQGREAFQMPVAWLYMPESLMGWFFTLPRGSLYRALQGHSEMSELSEGAVLSVRNIDLLCPCCCFCVAVHPVHQTRNFVILPVNLIHMGYFCLGTLPKFALNKIHFILPYSLHFYGI